MGLPTGIIYLIIMFLFIPFPFINWFEGGTLVHEQDPNFGTFPYDKVFTTIQIIHFFFKLKALFSWVKSWQPF
jgi:hypothetical protein